MSTTIAWCERLYRQFANPVFAERAYRIARRARRAVPAWVLVYLDTVLVEDFDASVTLRRKTIDKARTRQRDRAVYEACRYELGNRGAMAAQHAKRLQAAAAKLRQHAETLKRDPARRRLAESLDADARELEHSVLHWRDAAKKRDDLKYYVFPYIAARFDLQETTVKKIYHAAKPKLPKHPPRE